MMIKGKAAFEGERMQLLKSQVEHRLIFAQGVIPPSKFKNIVSAGAKSREFEWTKTFIENESQYLSPKFQESVTAFSYAALAYYQKDYKNVGPHLMQMEYVDLYFELDKKSLLLKTYFELGEQEAFDNLVHTFRSFISANKQIPPDQQTVYNNFISITAQLFLEFDTNFVLSTDNQSIIFFVSHHSYGE